MEKCLLPTRAPGAALVFTDEDKAFIRAILDVPEDRNTWLIYADWLDDRADPRSEFLRLMVARSVAAEDDPERVEMEARLRRLRAGLDPHWMMMFDPAPVGNCHLYSRRCGLWTEKAATEVPDIRVCYSCRQAVVYCHTLEEARAYDSCGQRVALSTRISPAQIAQEPALRELPRAGDSDAEFDLGLVDAVPLGTPAQSPEPQRPWWKFW
jgi:uncharacterized protein (TIGR02996 family)